MRATSARRATASIREAGKAGAFHEQFASRVQNAGSGLFAGRLTLTELIETRTHRDLTSFLFYCIVRLYKSYWADCPSNISHEETRVKESNVQLWLTPNTVWSLEWFKAVLDLLDHGEA